MKDTTKQLKPHKKQSADKGNYINNYERQYKCIFVGDASFLLSDLKENCIK